MSVLVDDTVRAIAWDLDGTIINSYAIFCQIVTNLAPKFGLETPTSEMLLTNFHGSLSDSIRDAFGGIEASVVAEIERNFLTEQQQYYLDIDEHILSDALSLAQKAKDAGIKQVIVTNREHVGRGRASPKSIVEQSELKDKIQHVICGDETHGIRKPDAGVFGSLLADWQVRPENLLVIGDQFVDAQLALNVGAKGIIVSRGSNTLAHADKLPAGWEQSIVVVRSLHQVQLGA